MRSAACEVKEQLLVLSVQLAIDRPEELNLLVILGDILVVGHLLDETNVIVVFDLLFFDYTHHAMPVQVVQIVVKISKDSFHTLLDVIHLDLALVGQLLEKSLLKRFEAKLNQELGLILFVLGLFVLFLGGMMFALFLNGLFGLFFSRRVLGLFFSSEVFGLFRNFKWNELASRVSPFPLFSLQC